MMRCWILFIPWIVFAASQTMLSQAEEIAQLYSKEIAKEPPPALFPMPTAALILSSTWLNFSDAAMLSQDETWKLLKEIGIDGVQISNIRKEGEIGLSSKWAKVWNQIVNHSQYQRISLVGDLIGNATIAGKDFFEALQNVNDYPNLYHLIEIDPADWNLLPSVAQNSFETNIPWLTLQTLHKKGYVPKNFTPYVKESDWNATDKILGKDGKTRRWIYLKEGNNHPVLAWLSPSFTAYRLAAGDAIHLIKELGMQFVQIDGNIPQMAQEMLSLWVRKIGGYSALKADGTIESMKNGSTDLIYDASTRPALLHALITQDAEALRVIYRLILDNKIETNRLIHALQPFDAYACDWVELMHAPKKKFRYYEEQLTGEVLKNRLMKEDVQRLGAVDKIAPSTWVDHCARALNIKDFEKHRAEISNAHLLLAFTYAMQSGVFSISYDDMVGTLPGSPSTNLYSDIPSQLTNKNSFTSKLKSILQARIESNIARGELIEVIQSPNPGTLLLLYRLPQNRFMYLLAINFARKETVESIEKATLSQTNAIDLISKLAEEKIFSSASFSFTLPPLSGRAFYFQPKYYD